MTPDQYQKETVDRLANYAKQLEGISYLDWIKLYHAIDQMFDHQKNERECHLKLVLAENFRNLFP